jgi:HSP90 family molecular chaperone
MTDEEKVIIDNLCKRIADEQDPTEFTKLVKELNDLLEDKHERLNHSPRSTDHGSSFQGVPGTVQSFSRAETQEQPRSKKVLNLR